MVGGIDGIITFSRLLRRGLPHEPTPAIREALADLADDEDVRWLLALAEKSTVRQAAPGLEACSECGAGGIDPSDCFDCSSCDGTGIARS